jgi:dihydropteroate synthase
MTLNCNGKILDLREPIVMGILNVTSDSFFAESRIKNESDLLKKTDKMLQDGVTILDIGAASSRPGAIEIPENEEVVQATHSISVIKKHFPDSIISIDTWRASVAKVALDTGADIINDISAASLDEKMLPFLGTQHNRPYILMHMQGNPTNMQQNPHYEDVVTEVLDFFIQKIAVLRELGITDIILDPGFGFGKTVAHNYSLLRNLHVFGTITGLPVLAGLSRKSMINKVLKINADAALNGTTALNMVALQQGAKILRVHDVKEAVEVIKLWQALEGEA